MYANGLRGQKAEDRGQKAEDRGQKESVLRGQNAPQMIECSQVYPGMPLRKVVYEEVLVQMLGLPVCAGYAKEVLF